jgi:hypothetical protein
MIFTDLRSDADYFRQSVRSASQSTDNWVLRFNALKRLYRLMTQYFTDVLQKPTGGLNVPDLQALAKDFSITPALGMCHFTIAIGVQCEKNKEFIAKIQELSETDQHYLMKAIEQVHTNSLSEREVNKLQVMAHITPLTGSLDVGENMTECVFSIRVIATPTDCPQRRPLLYDSITTQSDIFGKDVTGEGLPNFVKGAPHIANKL